MKLIKFLLFLPIISFSQTEINYEIFYSDSLQTDGLKVQLSFNSKVKTDSTYFHYSNQVWGEEKLFKLFDI